MAIKSQEKGKRASFDEYQRVVGERPRKLSETQVNYRPSEDPEQCRKCVHFYERRLDRFGVCEIFRSAETDQDGIQPEWVCDFWNQDGENFPLLT